MATVLERKLPPASKADARVRGELGRATARIRANDAVTGAAALVVLTLTYALAGVLLDQWLDLPRAARQLGFAGFLAAFAAVAYFRVVQPLRRAVNPRFAARQIEATAPGAKNAVINWVDLQDHALPDGVRAAVASHAADGLADADVTRATASRPLAWLGSAAGILVVALAVLLVVCKPAQFFSLLGRTFVPFTATRIAPRTAITLTAPANGDVTVTAGEPLTVAVGVGGRLPDPDGPDRVRLLFKHNPDAAEYDDLPLQPAAENGREFTLRVPDYVVQNGFWYKVAAGDAETPEHRVTVRSRPLFKGFEARYEYPAYLRMTPDVSRSPNLEAYRGTVVTLTAKTNRALKSGRLRVSGKPDALFGKVVGEAKDSLEFRLTLDEPGSYQLSFTSTTDEPSDASPAYPITVIADKAPTVEMTNPKDVETTLPADGLLAVDGAVGDDFGIDRVALHARVIPAKNDPPVVLTPKPYRDRSFRRGQDGSYPTSLEYKDSIPLKELKDSVGLPVKVGEGSVLEFWLEATDNCTEPTANVGRSRVYRVTLEKPADIPELKQQQQKDDVARRQADEKFQQQQDRKLDAEQRGPNQPPKRADADQQPQPADGQSGEPGEGQQANGQQPGEPKSDGTGSGKPTAGGTESKKPDGSASEQPGGKAESNPDGSAKDQTGSGTPQTNPNDSTKPQPGGKDEPKPGPKPDDAKLQEQANRVQQALNEASGQKDSTPKPDGKNPDGTKPDGKTPDGQKPPVSDASQKRPGDGQPKASDAPAGNPQPKPGTDPKTERPKPPDGAKPPPGQRNGDQPPDGQTPPDGSQSGPGQPGEGKPQSGQPNGPQPERGELDRLFGRDGQKVPPPDDTVERLKRDANDLASPEQLKREKAEEKFDDLLGRKEREKLQQAEKDRQSGNPAELKRAEEDVDELTKKSAKKEKANDLANKANDLASTDDARRQAAERSIDQELGKEGREQLQDAMKDVKSGDPARQKAGMDKLKQMADQVGGKQPSAEQMKDLAEAAKDLNSPDGEKRKAAEKKLDEQLGKDARKDLQQTANDLNSPDALKRQGAEDKLKEMAKNAGGQKPNPGEKQPTREDLERAAKDAEGLASDDPATRKAAEEKFDKALGEQKRKELQRAMKDAKPGSSTPEQQKDAKEKAEQLTKDAANKSPAGDASRKRMDDAKDLASTDDAKRNAAEEKFDKQMGRADREKLQRDVKAMQEGDQAAAERVNDQLAKPPVSDASQKRAAEELAKMAERAKDLTSDDKAKREAAEQEIDKAIGKDQREKLQQMAKDMASDDPRKAEEAKRKLDEMVKDAMKGTPDGNFRPNGRSGSPGEEAKPIDGDVNDRLKSAELQLARLQEAKDKYKDELQKKLGYGEKEYADFVKSYEEMVNRLRAEAAESAPKKANPMPPAGPPTTRVGESGSAGFQPGGPTATVTGAGAGTAPPGFADAQRRFAEEAAKRGKK